MMEGGAPVGDTSDGVGEKGCWADATDEVEGGKLVECLCRMRWR